MSLRTRLSKPLVMSDGRSLRTVGDAIEVVLEMPNHALAASEWTQVPRLLKAACFSGDDDDAARATSRLEAALSAAPFGNARLADKNKKPPARSVRRRSKRTPAISRPSKAKTAPARAKAKRQ
jgi:hypothetical protein